MYAVIKAVLRELGAPDIGGVRRPLSDIVPEDMPTVRKCAEHIRTACEKFVK